MKPHQAKNHQAKLERPEGQLASSQDIANLRQLYPAFCYQQAQWQLQDQGLEIKHTYKLEGKEKNKDHLFTHRLLFVGVKPNHLDHISTERLDQWAFQLGLVEIFNYWKTTCSPSIKIQAGNLDDKQKSWWQKLLIKGMGEFFYQNRIDFTPKNWVTWKNDYRAGHQTGRQADRQPDSQATNQPCVLIPVGGGKDSVVTLNFVLDSQTQSKAGCLLINPTQAATEIATLSKLPTIVIKRQLDPTLFELNRQGYLNGHVPISAVFAFLSVFAAELFGYDWVAISNERSANEGNVEYHQATINHQYSKSFEFEKDFSNYLKSYLKQAPYYFSLLRPLYELQIAGLFANHTKYHQIFRSCNRGQKTNSWCLTCPKCLFAYLILDPFLTNQEMMAIFGRNLWLEQESNQDEPSSEHQSETLLEIALNMMKEESPKPFECVGTREEVVVAFYLATQKALAKNSKLPFLLKNIKAQVLDHESDLPKRAQAVLESWDHEHLIPEEGWVKKLQETATNNPKIKAVDL